MVYAEHGYHTERYVIKHLISSHRIRPMTPFWLQIPSEPIRYHHRYHPEHYLKHHDHLLINLVQNLGLLRIININTSICSASSRSFIPRPLSMGNPNRPLFPRRSSLGSDFRADHPRSHRLGIRPWLAFVPLSTHQDMRTLILYCNRCNNRDS